MQLDRGAVDPIERRARARTTRGPSTAARAMLGDDTLRHAELLGGPRSTLERGRSSSTETAERGWVEFGDELHIRDADGVAIRLRTRGATRAALVP